MFKLTYSHIQDYQFVQALAKLASHNYQTNKNRTGPAIAYNIAKIKRKFESEAEISQTLFLKLVKQYCKLTDKGEVEPMTRDGKPMPGTFEIKDENKETWIAKKKEFDDTEIEIQCHKVYLGDLEGVDISPADMDKLMPLIEENEPAAKSPTGVVRNMNAPRPVEQQPNA